MNTMIEEINSMGRSFVEFAFPVLVQSSALIVILLLVDLVLRRKVRAVFRYCIWMLVLAKLVLPSSLSSPMSLGYWFGDELRYVSVSSTNTTAETVEMSQIAEPAPVEAGPHFAKDRKMEPQASGKVPTIAFPPAAEAEPVAAEAAGRPVVTWQAVAFLVWLGVVGAMAMLLLQRALFVRGLVAQARNANNLMNDAFGYCRRQMGMKRKVGLKVSANATSPAVCGLFRPVILVPADLGPSLGAGHLRVVLMHELAHIKRGDLWVNLVQTVLQIVYFYNPLLWLANSMIRRVREQAVDEAVQVAMGEKAQQYPQTLVNVAKLAFKRPALSLRLIGVVESRNLLKWRIKRMLNRPIPKSAKLSVLGLVLLLLIGAVLLPMAKAQKQPADNASAVLDSDKDGLENRLEAELGTNPKLSDTDGDGLSDYDEYCKYRTDPTKKDSDGDGKPDGDWQERREYTYTIRAFCEIRPPSTLEAINDLYQDARPVDRKASLQDATAVEVLLFPFATAHIHAQQCPKESLDKSLKEYIQPTVSMNFSPEMKQQITDIVKDAATDVEAIEKMLRWMSSETELVKYNPHWDYFHVINDEIVRHNSLGDSEQDGQFLETNFFGDSMFKNKVHGTCSSTAILRGTMFRAAGIPTRLIQTLPLITRYSEDPEPLADRLRMRSMAKGYDWGPGSGGANHMYNEVFLNNRWVRIDNSVGVGPFVGDKLFVKAWSAAGLNNIKEEWNDKRCFRTLDVSDAYPKYESEATRPDIAIQDRDLTVKKLPDGQFRATIIIHNNGQEPTPRLKVLFYAGDPERGGRKVHPGHHRAGPIMPGNVWREGTYPFSFKEGENEIFVVVDPDNMVDESDETNNKAFTVVGSSAPKEVGDLDIAVEDFKIIFRDKYNAYYVVASIRNKGKDVSPQFPVYFYIGDPAVAEPITHAAGPIKPGRVWNERSGNFGLPEGVNMISVAVDPHNAFAESDETNNRAWLSVVVEDGRIVKTDTEVEKKSEPDAEQADKIKRVARMVIGSSGRKLESIEEFLVPLASGSQLAVENTNGSVKVSGRETGECRIKAAIEVKARNAKDARNLMDKVKVNVTQRGRKLLVKVKQPKLQKKQSVKVDFDIYLANKVDLALHTNNGEIKIADITGEIEGKTNNGAITAVRIVGDTRLHTNNGKVNISEADFAPGAVTANNGRITCKQISGDIQVKTNNGEVNISEADFASGVVTANNGRITCKQISGDIQVKTNNGRVEVSYAKTAPSVCNVSINTNNGAIDFTGPPNFSAVVEAETQTGSIRTDLPLTVKGLIGKTVSGTLGKGEGKLHLETSHGSIRIRSR